MKKQLLLLALFALILVAAQAQTYDVTIGDPGTAAVGAIKLNELPVSGTNYVGLAAPTTLAGDILFTLPSLFPSASGYVLTATTAGVMSWTNPASLGVKWNALTDPDGALTLNHGTNATIFNFANTTTTGFAMNTTAQTTGNLLSLNSSNAASTGNAFLVSSNSTGASANGIVRYNFTGAHTNNGFQIDDATTTGTAMAVNANSITTGAGNGLVVNANGMTSSTGNALLVSSTGAYTGANGIFAVTANSATTGNVAKITSNGLTTGTALDISSASTAGNNSKLINLTRSGTNGAAAMTNYGVFSSITNTNATSATNVAGYFNASGASPAANYAIIVPASGGDVGIGTSGPVNLTPSSTPTIIHLHDAGTSATDFGQLNISTATTASGNRTGVINFAATAATSERRSAVIESYLTAASGTNASGDLRFSTSNAAAPTEKMRISSNGTVTVGSTYSVPTSTLFTAASQAQMILGGAHNQEFNVGADRVKLLITGHDNDNATSVYPIFIEDENGLDDFWIRNRQNEATGLPTMFFGGNFGIRNPTPYATFTNAGSTAFGTLALTNFAANAAIGTAAATVDIYTAININQTTASITLTIPSPTTTTAGRILKIANVGSAAFTVGGVAVGPAQSTDFFWNGTAWVAEVGASSPSLTVPISGLLAATATNTIDNTNYAQTWNWSTATTQNPLTINANALTTGTALNIASTGTYTGANGIFAVTANSATTGTVAKITSNGITSGTALSVTSSGASLNSTNGLFYLANTGATSNGILARLQSNSTAGSGLTVRTNGNVGIGSTTAATKFEITAGIARENGYNMAVAGVDNMLLNGDFEMNRTDGWSVTAGTMAIVTGGYTGSYAMQITGNSGNFLSDDYIPVDPTRDVLYLEAYLKKTVAGTTPGVLYFGYIAYDATRTAITSAPCGTYCYFAASSYTLPVDGNWHKFASTTTGEGTSYPNFPVGTKYVRVLGLINYAASADAVTQIDHIVVKRLNNGPLFVGNNFASTNLVDQHQVSKIYTTTSNHLVLEPTGTGCVGIGVVPSSTTYKLNVQGGKLLTAGIDENSDIRLKKDINPIYDALQKVNQMRGVTYHWRKDEFPERSMETDLQYGLIAQELEKIIPELVTTDGDGYKAIEYSHLVPVLIEAIKELDAKNNAQKAELAQQSKTNEELKASIESLLIRMNAVENNLEGKINKAEK